MEFNGKITHKTKKEVVGQKQTEKQSIRVEETEGEYPNAMFVDFFGKSQPLLDEVNVWDIVTVSVNVKCSEYKGRWFTNLGWWKIEVNSKWGEVSWWDDLPF